MRNNRCPKLCLVLYVLLVALVSVACLNAEGVAPPPGELTEDRRDRTDCVAISGTAFRSSSERDWYNANCSAWPPLPVDPGPARTAAPAYVPPPAECATMRGKPYTSNEQRAWYLANCNGQPPLPGVAAPPPPPPGQGGSDPQVATNQNRANCDQIRGAPYLGPAERDWYLQNCPPTPAAPPPAADTGPIRTNCDEIRGTSYRSPAERDWYLANCPQQTAPASQPQPVPAPQQQFQLLPPQNQIIVPQQVVPAPQPNDDDQRNRNSSPGRSSQRGRGNDDYQ